MDVHHVLVVRLCGENLRLSRRDDRATRYDFSHHTSSGLNSQRERCNIEEEEVLCCISSSTTEHATLHGRPISNRFVWVDAF
mmetsp:Transcript_110856/g.201563  ORF Transcript_110856/g.201563 Transcript_110856/m.201563 type:complete len:82 (-) Transcript_110856:20-265(-)